MNGEVCCILGICCPPNSEAQREALARELVKDGLAHPREASGLAEWILKHFDLAPAGSLVGLKAAITTMARAHRP